MWIIPCCVLKLDDCLHVILLCLLQVSKSPRVGLSWRYEIILANNSLALQGGKNLVRCSQCFTESWWYRILFETCPFSMNIFRGYDWGYRINRCKNHPPFDFTHFFTIEGPLPIHKMWTPSVVKPVGAVWHLNWGSRLTNIVFISL